MSACPVLVSRIMGMIVSEPARHNSEWVVRRKLHSLLINLNLYVRHEGRKLKDNTAEVRNGHERTKGKTKTRLKSFLGTKPL